MQRRKKTTPRDVAPKTYILQLKGSDVRRVTLPGHYTLTFGPLVPGVSRRDPQHAGIAALRVYDGKTQLACFTDVVAFRDAAIAIEERRTSVKRQTVSKKTPQGHRDVEVEARVTEWVNPDDVAAEGNTPPSEFLRIETRRADDDEDLF